tara:strand:- start:885 stop:1247 length:363 start_codon:yes stop_codon:yes gene_type:complete
MFHVPYLFPEKNLKYKKRFGLQYRIAEFKRLTNKYRNRIPVIIEHDYEPGTHKYLVGENMTLAQMFCVFKKDLEYNETIYFMINKNIVSSIYTMGELYRKFADEEDRFLYITYRKEEFLG